MDLFNKRSWLRSVLVAQRPILYALGLLVVLAATGYLSSQRYALAPLVLLTAVVATALRSGVVAGLYSALLALVFNGYLVFGFFEGFQITAQAIRRTWVLVPVLPAIAIIIGRLKERADRSLERERDARIAAERAAHDLAEREERFRLLVQNSFDIITIFAPDGTIQYQSQSIQRVLGYLPEERMGNNIFRGSLVHPDDMAIKAGAFRQALQTSKPVGATFRLRHRDGGWRVIEAIFYNALREPSIAGIIGNYRDVTERERLERQKDDFIAIASHELKTPVTSLKAFTQVLQRRASRGGDAETGAMLGRMDGQLDRLTRLIGDLLDVTRIESGKLQLRPTPFDFNTVVAETVEALQLSSERHTIKISGRADQEVTADRERIAQVLINLIGNAVKYSPEGDRVIVHVGSRDGGVYVDVEDFGIGIEKDLQRRVFERFFRVGGPVPETFSGLGLGLFISSEIVSRHGGRMDVWSEPGRGSRFCFWLPARPFAASLPVGAVEDGRPRANPITRHD